MAKPQIEDGHVDIAHEIVEALCRINLTAYESRVLWALFRKTYGWHKAWDRISYTQWEEITGLNRWHIARTLKQLIARKIITQRGDGYKIEYAFQKDYEQWIRGFHRHDLLPSGATEEKSLPRGEKSLPRGEKPLPSGATKSLPRGVNTKEKKETIQKKLYKRKYGEFKNVLLSDDEYQKLKDRFGALVPDMIETLSEGIESKGYKYRSHYATLLAWKRRDERMKGGHDGAHRGRAGSRQLPKVYRTPEEIWPNDS